MVAKKFQIPAWATSKLREVDATRLNPKSDSDIMEELRRFHPVTSEKNVWGFWDKGLDNMNQVCMRTVLDWVRKLGRTWTVRIVDYVEGSPNHIHRYINPAYFPESFNHGLVDGKSRGQNLSDLARLPLLYEYGGVWVDVGMVLHADFDRLFWDTLSDPSNEYEMVSCIINGYLRKPFGSCINGFIAARKGSQFVKNWHECYKELWKGHTNTDGMHVHPMIQEVGLAELIGNLPGFGHLVESVSSYASQMLLYDRIRNLVDVETKWNGREYFEKRILLVDMIAHGNQGELSVNHDCFKMLELYTTKLDEPDESKRREAEEYFVNVLSTGYIEKYYHHLTGEFKTFGDLVKSPEHKMAECMPGTFGELYRYGAIHWEAIEAPEFLTVPPNEDSLIYATPTEPAKNFN